MPRKKNSIPVNQFADETNQGISIEQISLKDLNLFADAHQAHRHDSHSFMLLEQGSVTIEVDFHIHKINAPSVIYMHPNQVHLILAFKDVTVCSLAITNENLNPEYLALLEDLTPASPLKLNAEKFSTLQESASLCMKCAVRIRNRLNTSLLRDTCNTLVALIISEYLENSKTTDKLSRSGIVARAFMQNLERHYTTIKRPAGYASQLNISTAYLNECLKNATGHSVSYHIQARVVLEAKRQLCHADMSIKEIAASLGYDDYQYFSRLFTKVASTTPQAFRQKNRV